MITFQPVQNIDNCKVAVMNIRWKNGSNCYHALVKNGKSYYIAEYRSHGWSGSSQEGWAIDPKPSLSMIGVSHLTGDGAVKAFIAANEANMVLPKK